MSVHFSGQTPYLWDMKIDIISVLPELMESFFSHSILKRAKEKGLLQVNLFNLREYTNYKHGQVDDYQFGGGAGLCGMRKTNISVYVPAG